MSKRETFFLWMNLKSKMRRSINLRFLAAAGVVTVFATTSFAADGQCSYVRNLTEMFARKRDSGVPENVLIKSIYMLDGGGQITDSDAEVKVRFVKQIYGVAAGLSPGEIGDLYYGNCKTAEISSR